MIFHIFLQKDIFVYAYLPHSELDSYVAYMTINELCREHWAHILIAYLWYVITAPLYDTVLLVLVEDNMYTYFLQQAISCDCSEHWNKVRFIVNQHFVNIVDCSISPSCTLATRRPGSAKTGLLRFGRKSIFPRSDARLLEQSHFRPIGSCPDWSSENKKTAL